MSNWICDKCGANYIDVSHQEPSVLKQELEIRELKRLLRECLDWFIWYQTDTGTGKPYIEAWQKKGRDLRNKINEVLK